MLHEMANKKGFLFYVYCVMLLLLITLFILSNEKEKVVPSIRVAKNHTLQPTKNILNGSFLDGCYHVYIDIGSNIGIQVRKLFEPEKLPKSKLHSIFNTNFGSVQERRLAGLEQTRTVCAVGIEPNSHHTNYLKRIEKGYQKCGWRANFLTETAISDRTGQSRFYTDEAYEFMEWGGGILPPNINSAAVDIVKNKRKAKYNNVTLIKLSDFLTDIVGKRNLPMKPSKSHPPRVLVKMDIEGSEVSVLPDLFFRGGLEHVNIMMIEWHKRLEKLEMRKNAQKVLKTILTNLSEYSKIMRKHTKTGLDFDFQLLDIDDESYFDAKFKIPDCSKIHDYVLD